MRGINECEVIVVKSKKIKLILSLRYGYKEYTADIECRTVWCAVAQGVSPDIECRTVWCAVAQGVSQWMDCFY
jgi:hypothetical protein